MRVFLLCGLLQLAASTVWAGVRVEVDGEVPFTAEELADAVDARAALADGTLLRVAPADGDVELEGGGRSRRVPLGERTGTAAARVVALAAVDLFITEAAPPELPPLAARRTVLHAAILGGVAKGTGGAEPFTMALAIEVGVPVGERFRAAVAATWWSVPTEDAGRPTEVSFDAWPIRLGAGLALGPVELYAGPFIAPYRVGGTGKGAGLLGGGGAWAVGGVRLPAGLSLVAAGGVDLFGRRVEVQADFRPEPLFRSPRVSFWVGAGLRFEVAR